MPSTMTWTTTNVLVKAVNASRTRNHLWRNRPLVATPSTCVGGHWTICTHHDNTTGCVALSIGIGNDWSYENVLLKHGCEVHAFDPTKALQKKHEQEAARIRERFPLLHFHLIGLGSSLSLNSAYNQHHTTGSDLAQVIQLDDMMTTYVPGRRVNVLKIDCEGCEYEAFDYVVSRAPWLLCNISQVNIELHYSHRYHKLRDASQLTRLLTHLFDDHGFRIFKAGSNVGWKEEARTVHPELLRWGWPTYGCCHNVQLIRPKGRLDGAGMPACTKTLAR